MEGGRTSNMALGALHQALRLLLQRTCARVPLVGADDSTSLCGWEMATMGEGGLVVGLGGVGAS